MQTAMNILANLLAAPAWERRARIAVAAIIAVAAAIQPVLAQSRGRGSLLNLPTASEAAAPAAAVVSEVPFQRFVQLTCEAAHCRSRLSAVAAKERLVIQFVSCNAVLTAGDLQSFILIVTNARNTKVFGAHFIAPQYQSSRSAIRFVASQPMLTTVEANLVLHLQASAGGGDVTYAACGISGVKQKLG